MVLVMGGVDFCKRQPQARTIYSTWYISGIYCQSGGFFSVKPDFYKNAQELGGTSYKWDEITPISRVFSPQVPIYFRPLWGDYFTPIIMSGSGPTLKVKMEP